MNRKPICILANFILNGSQLYPIAISEVLEIVYGHHKNYEYQFVRQGQKKIKQVESLDP